MVSLISFRIFPQIVYSARSKLYRSNSCIVFLELTFHDPTGLDVDLCFLFLNQAWAHLEVRFMYCKAGFDETLLH